jgi:hypothetical protein
MDAFILRALQGGKEKVGVPLAFARVVDNSPRTLGE